jgi:putative transposase
MLLAAVGVGCGRPYPPTTGGRHVPTALPVRPPDQEWAILEPLLSSTEKRGCPPKWPLRHVADAVFYLLRSGCSWRMLPREYPPWQTVYYHFRKWRIDGRLRRAHDRLRDAVREAEGRERDPSAAVVDSQVVKTTPVGGPERGYDGAKRLAGRKRHLLVDTNGLVLAARVHSADLPDRDGGRQLLGEGQELQRMELLWADGAYTGGFREWLRRQLGWRMEVPHHRYKQLWRYGLEEKPRGFQVLPRRWVVERTFAWLGLSRRLSKDYERLPETAETMIYGVMSRLMLRRLAHTA